MGPHYTQKLLHRKENHKQNEKKKKCTEWEKIFANKVTKK